jgi:hypothetical protein
MNVRWIKRPGQASTDASKAIRRAVGLTLLVTACALSAVGAGSTYASAGALGPPAGGPDLAQIAFAESDFPGSKVKRQGYVRPDPDLGFIAEYEREFRVLSVKLGRKRLVGLENDVALARNADDAQSVITFFVLGLALGSDEVAKSLAKEFGVKPTAVRVGPPRKAGGGEESVAIRIRIATRAGEVHIVLAIVRVGRVVSLFYLAGLPKVRLGPAEIKRLAQLAARHMRDGLAPTNISLPATAGIAQAGQFLTASLGAWSNAPGGFAYQWQRCDATGAACTDRAGATAQSYPVASEDVGLTLRVAVRASNKYGSRTAFSLPTPIVSVAGAPINTQLPTISGTATVGQTLTGAPGSWSGSPTAFAYQWQRCSNQGTGCAAIAGATTESYTVASVDAGSTLRLVVTATNTAGSASAASAPTGVVT